MGKWVSGGPSSEVSLAWALAGWLTAVAAAAWLTERVSLSSLIFPMVSVSRSFESRLPLFFFPEFGL